MKATPSVGLHLLRAKDIYHRNAGGRRKEEGFACFGTKQYYDKDNILIMAASPALIVERRQVEVSISLIG